MSSEDPAPCKSCHRNVVVMVTSGQCNNSRIAVLMIIMVRLYIHDIHILAIACVLLILKCFWNQVLMFSEKKAEVDDIHEYLLLKGVEAVAIHAGKGTYSSFIISHDQLYLNSVCS